MKLLKVDLLEEAAEKLKKYLTEPEAENVKLSDALGRTVSEDIFSDCDVPNFTRSTVDGYAVKAQYTQGASDSMPVFLDCVGEVLMGESTSLVLGPNETCYVPTGGMLPEGADSVVMVEYCEEFGSDKIAVYHASGVGDNRVCKGDDIAKNARVIECGRKLRPQDIGLLSSVGKLDIPCFKPWSLYIISTGDELVSPDCEPAPGEVRDINSCSLISEAKSFGFNVVGSSFVKDDEAKLREEIRRGKALADFCIISGGSSQGKKDMTEKLIGEESSSGILTHGIAVKPGKPTVLGYDEVSRTALVGLPGHPVAALLLFRFIVEELYISVTDQKKRPVPSVIGKMAVNIAASPGRKTFQLVSVDENRLITPILGKSGLIRTMSEADGYIILDVNSEGINKGEETPVYLLI